MEFIQYFVADVICVSFMSAIISTWYSDHDPNIPCYLIGLLVIAAAWIVVKKSLLANVRKLKHDSDQYQKYLGHVEYNEEKNFDDTFSRVSEKLKENRDYHVRLLNYTGCGSPDRFCENAASLLCAAANNAMPLNGGQGFTIDNVTVPVSTIRCTGIKEPWLIDCRNLLNRAKEKGIHDFAEFLSRIGTYRNSLDATIEQIVQGMVDSKNQARYLMREIFSLWDPSSNFRLTRMYYLAVDRTAGIVENTTERFMFSCASVINSLFSRRYSLGILPGRLAYINADQFNYYIINALSSDRASAWVLSGLGTRQQESSETKFPYSLVLRAGQKDEEWIVGCKCHQIGDYSEVVWRELRKSQLVLYDASTSLPTVYLGRFRQLCNVFCNHLGPPDRVDALKKFFEIFCTMISHAKDVELCRLPDSQDSSAVENIDTLPRRDRFCDSKGEHLLTGEITWKNGDLKRFKDFFLE